MGRYEDDRDWRRERIEYELSDMFLERDMQRARESRRRQEAKNNQWREEQKRRYLESHTYEEYMEWECRRLRRDRIFMVVVYVVLIVGVIIFFWMI